MEQDPDIKNDVVQLKETPSKTTDKPVGLSESKHLALSKVKVEPVRTQSAS